MGPRRPGGCIVIARLAEQENTWVNDLLAGVNLSEVLDAWD